MQGEKLESVFFHVTSCELVLSCCLQALSFSDLEVAHLAKLGVHEEKPLVKGVAMRIINSFVQQGKHYQSLTDFWRKNSPSLSESLRSIERTTSLVVSNWVYPRKYRISDDIKLTDWGGQPDFGWPYNSGGHCFPFVKGHVPLHFSGAEALYL